VLVVPWEFNEDGRARIFSPATTRTAIEATDGIRTLMLTLKVLLALPLAFAVACSADGGGDPCSPIPGARVSPQSATVDHQAAPPGNSQQFFAFAVASPGCVAPHSNLLNVTWSVSDMTNVNISNAKDGTFGTATCIGATSGPVTITATLPAGANNGQSVKGTAALTCK